MLESTKSLKVCCLITARISSDTLFDSSPNDSSKYAASFSSNVNFSAIFFAGTRSNSRALSTSLNVIVTLAALDSSRDNASSSSFLADSSARSPSKVYLYCLVSTIAIFLSVKGNPSLLDFSSALNNSLSTACVCFCDCAVVDVATSLFTYLLKSPGLYASGTALILLANTCKSSNLIEAKPTDLFSPFVILINFSAPPSRVVAEYLYKYVAASKALAFSYSVVLNSSTASSGRIIKPYILLLNKLSVTLLPAERIIFVAAASRTYFSKATTSLYLSGEMYCSFKVSLVSSIFAASVNDKYVPAVFGIASEAPTLLTISSAISPNSDINFLKVIAGIALPVSVMIDCFVASITLIILFMSVSCLLTSVLLTSP